MFQTLKNKNTKLILLTFSMMITLGFIANVKGVLIPEIKKDFAVSYSKIGALLFISSLGMMITTFFGGLAGDKFGQRVVIVAGTVFIISSIIGFSLVNSIIMVMVLMFGLHLGFGCMEIGANTLGALIFTENSAVMMNLLHLFFGIGSSIGPKFAGWLVARNVSWEMIYMYSFSLLSLVIILLAVSDFPEPDKEEKSQKIPVKKIIRNKKVWLFVGLLGASILSEIGIASWLVNFLQKVKGMNESSSSFYLSIFFVTFTVGRLVGGYIAEYLGYIKIILYFAVTAILLNVGGLLLGKEAAILFSFVGFFISILFPITITLMMKEFDQGLSSIMGFVITAAHGVNMVGNWLIGTFTDFFGVFLGFSSILLFISLIILFIGLLNRNLTFLNKGGNVN